jgi:hypothetical protein
VMRLWDDEVGLTSLSAIRPTSITLRHWNDTRMYGQQWNRGIGSGPKFVYLVRTVLYHRTFRLNMSPFL